MKLNVNKFLGTDYKHPVIEGDVNGIICRLMMYPEYRDRYGDESSDVQVIEVKNAINTQKTNEEAM